MGKKRAANKTKEEILRDMELARKRAIIVDRFYPALKTATISIDEAKMLLQAMGSYIMEDVLATMKERKFSELQTKMLSALTTDGQRVEELTALLGVFADENLYVSRELIEGMARAIDQMIMEETQRKTLNDLQPDWDKYLNK